MNTFAARRARFVSLAGLGLAALVGLTGCEDPELLDDDITNADLDPDAMGGQDDDSDDDDDDTTNADPMPGIPPTAPDPEEPAPELETCAAVDVLFVVDNSDTMAEEQAKLLSSAGGFIGDAAALLPADTSFHVGVVTTDSYDMVRSGPEGQCNFAVDEGLGYATHSGALDLELGEALTCAVDVGTQGDPNERPVEMALSALGPEAQLSDAVNGGFLREDAVLVVVVLTDEEDDFEAVTDWGSAGDPEDWANELSDIVYGVDERVVVVSLVGAQKPNACPEFQWNGQEGAELAPRLIEFTNSFAHGVVGDVCATSYTDVLSDAALEISAACG